MAAGMSSTENPLNALVFSNMASYLLPATLPSTPDRKPDPREVSKRGVSGGAGVGGGLELGPPRLLMRWTTSGRAGIVARKHPAAHADRRVAAVHCRVHQVRPLPSHRKLRPLIETCNFANPIKIVED